MKNAWNDLTISMETYREMGMKRPAKINLHSVELYARKEGWAIKRS
jgi:hypothetical protein